MLAVLADLLLMVAPCRLPADFVSRVHSKLRPGRLLRFTIQAGGMYFVNGKPQGADLKYEGPANQRRGRADLFSKIMFQYVARREPLLFESLEKASSDRSN